MMQEMYDFESQQVFDAAHALKPADGTSIGVIRTGEQFRLLLIFREGAGYSEKEGALVHVQRQVRDLYPNIKIEARQSTEE